MFKEKYTKRVPEELHTRDLADLADNQRRRSAAAAFNNLPFEQRRHKIRAERLKTARDIVLPVAVLGSLAVAGHETTGAPWHVKNSDVPIEKSGGHRGEVPLQGIGTAVMHTKSGDFHVTQK